MQKKEINKKQRVKKDLDYYKNLKKDIEKQIKILATKESVRKRKELYKKRSIIGKYMLDLFDLEDETIDKKSLGDVFEEFLLSLDETDKSLFIEINDDTPTPVNTSVQNKNHNAYDDEFYDD
ncbi:MAG: hypothetical protein GKC53_05420 [Neisseriaceae bacterium]|nr:MAG: hypothetical protein GKC53_05420 [Neisseriaceae bacterium]